MIQNNGYPGLYIVLEGIIGTGKSTQMKLLQEEFAGRPDVVFTREPGGTPMAEEIRAIVKSRKLAPLEEAQLFAEARKSTLEEVVIPALQEGKTVVSDRSIISSLAYQGYGRKLGFNKVWEVNRGLVRQIPLPDCVFYFELPLYIARERSGKANTDQFDVEERQFWLDVLEGYGRILQSFRRENPKIKIVPLYDGKGDLSPEAVHKLVWREVRQSIHNWEKTREGDIVCEHEH